MLAAWGRGGVQIKWKTTDLHYSRDGEENPDFPAIIAQLWGDYPRKLLRIVRFTVS